MNTGKGNVPTPSAGAARASLSLARRARAEHLLAVAEDLLDVDDVIRAACTAEGAPLRRLTLRQLLLAKPGFGPQTVRNLLEQLGAVCGVGDDARMTVAWLVDSRTHGRRMTAWIDLVVRHSPPPAGFPFAPLHPGSAS